MSDHMPWETCKHHGPARPRVWACPTCLVELRAERDALAADLERERAHQFRAMHDHKVCNGRMVGEPPRYAPDCVALRDRADALAARVGVLTGLLTEAARVIRAINVEEYGAVPDALPITSRIDAALAEPSAPVEAASEAPSEEDLRMALAAALGWPGGISAEPADWTALLRHVARLRVAAPEAPAEPVMPKGCTTPDGCRAHGCHGACIPRAPAEPVAELCGAEYLADPRTGQAFQASTVATWPAYNRERFTIRLWSAHPIASAIAAARAEGYAAGMDRAEEVCSEIEDQAWALWKTTADPIEQGRSIGADHCADAIRAAKGE